MSLQDVLNEIVSFMKFMRFYNALLVIAYVCHMIVGAIIVNDSKDIGNALPNLWGYCLMSVIFSGYSSVWILYTVIRGKRRDTADYFAESGKDSNRGWIWQTSIFVIIEMIWGAITYSKLAKDNSFLLQYQDTTSHTYLLYLYYVTFWMSVGI